MTTRDPYPLATAAHRAYAERVAKAMAAIAASRAERYAEWQRLYGSTSSPRNRGKESA